MTKNQLLKLGNKFKSTIPTLNNFDSLSYFKKSTFDFIS